MSIRIFGDNKEHKVNVYLRNNEKTEYIGCDIPPTPYGNKCFSFWFNDMLISIPLARISKIEMYSHE